MSPVIESFINDRIKVNSDFTPQEVVVAAAFAMIGIREEGQNTGELVSAIQDTVGGPDPWAWCMSFVQTAYAYAEKRLSLSCNLPESEHCLSVFNEGVRRRIVVAAPEPGDIIIWQKSGTLLGHTGIVWSIKKDNGLLVVEGNSAPQQGESIQREGEGVHLLARSQGGSPRMPVIGFLRPQWAARGEDRTS